MPLLGAEKTAFQLLPPPDHSKLSPDTNEFWQIRFTGEIFSSYEEYSARLLLYRQRIWTCSITSIDSLTFEEALVSEQKGRTTSSKLPIPVQKKILELTQFSTVTRMDQLCDVILTYLKEHFVIGEEVYLKKADGYYHPVTVLEVIEVPDSQKRSIDGNLESVEVKYLVEEVHPSNENGSKRDQIEVSFAALSRTRNAISKILIRNLIKESASKENFLGAPWIIREELAEQFKISTIPPDNVWDADTKTFKRRKKAHKADDTSTTQDTQASSSQGPPKLPKPRYPIEDTELPYYNKSRSHPEMETSAVPLPKDTFDVPKECVPNLLFVWSSLFVYCEPLLLFPFSFDDLARVLTRHTLPYSPIISEIHLSLLKIAAEHTTSVISKLVKQGVKPGRIIARSSFVAKSKSEGLEEDATELISTAQPSNGPPTEDEAQATQISTEDDVEMEIHADLPPEDSHIINYMDYTYTGAWWKWRPDDATWIKSLLAYLFHLATIRDLPCFAEVVEHLTGESPILDTITGRLFLVSKYPWKADNLQEKYIELPLEHKIEILSFIVKESVIPSNRIRKYMEECNLQVTELKKEKRELDAKMKEILVEQKELDRQANPEQESAEGTSTQQSENETKTSLNVEEDANGNEEDSDAEVADEGDEDSDSDLSDAEEDDPEIRDMKTRLAEMESQEGKYSRQDKIRLQSQIKELEDERQSAKLEAARALARQKYAAKRERLEVKRKIDTDMSKLLKRDFTLDRELRKFSGALRLKPLGRDRFWNKYWWVDGYGSGVTSIQEYGVTGPYSKANTIAFGTGRLWVEGSGAPEYLGQVSGGVNGLLRRKRKPTAAAESTKKGVKDVEGLDGFLTFPQEHHSTEPGISIGQNWLEVGEWRYYDDPEQIDEILCWLNPKGVREQLLKSNLLKYYDQIAHNLKKRQEEVQHLLEQDEILTTKQQPSRGRPKSQQTLEPWMYYTNRWAK